MNNTQNTTNLAPDDDPPMPARGKVAAFLFILFALFCLTPWASPPIALGLGVALALTLGNPFTEGIKPWVNPLLRGSVVLLGFGMNLPAVLQAGARGAGFAAFTILLTLALAAWTGRKLGVDSAVSKLIGSGTAICGGSAIAAVSGVIEARPEAITVSMGAVFILNAVALLIFPIIGHAIGLSQEQFGVWAGVAIHDVSSVVGAAQVYGQRALEVAAAIKLSRTLWIIPICLLLGWRQQRVANRCCESDKPRRLKAPIPWFIGLFLLASVARTVSPQVTQWSPALVDLAKTGLTLTLFLIGAGMSRRMLAHTGWKPLLQGVMLWFAISVVSLAVVIIGG